MKRLALAALLLVLAGQAFALEALPTSSKPRNLRVAVVRDDSQNGVGVTTQNANRLNMDRALGGLIPALARQGCQVDRFNSSWFLKSTNMTNSEATLWKNLGDTYALVFVEGAIALGTKTAGATNTVRFYRADSTNAQLFLIYGNRSKEMSGGDSTFAQVVAATSAPANWVSSSGETATGSRIAYRPYGSSDTIWVPLHGTPPAAGNVASGITGVVRWLEPLRIGGTLNPLTNADSVLVSFPAAGDSTASSAGGVYELLGPGWRTYYDNGRWVENACSQYSSPLYTRNVAPIAYAIAARYLDVKPILVAGEMDDVFDMVTAGDSTVTPRRWSNAGYDSLFTRWRDTYGFKPAVTVNPLHAYEYIRGDNPTWETSNQWSHRLDAPWVGDPWKWPRKHAVSWIYHSHDSSAARVTSNLVGRYGGYQGAGNGLTNTSGGQVSYAYHRQPAFAWNPGRAFHERRYGIYQKLMYSDSLRRLVCPECVVPPYLSFPNNEVVPVNWRVRAEVANYVSYRSPAADSVCTVDSTFLAMARGLRIPSGGTLYIRGTVHDGSGSPGSVPSTGLRPWGTDSPKNVYTGAEQRIAANDSIIAKTPFLYPGEVRIVRDSNDTTNVAHVPGDGKSYWVRVRNVGCLPFDATSVNIQEARSLSMRALSKLLGFWSAVNDGSASGPVDANGDYLGFAYSADPTGAYGTSAEQRGYTRDRPRVIYFHPNNWTGSTGVVPTGPGRNSQTDNFEQQILMPVKALNTLAGKTIIRWVQPWEVYGQ